jgi:hypothetical protein
MRYRRPVVQLTALLDLLFIMIFVTLNQAKSTSSAPEAKAAVETPKIEVPKVVETKKPVQKEILVSAEFFFYGTNAQPNIPSGSYMMKGTFDTGTGELQLGGTSWVKRPEGYDMVPLKGVINTSRTSFTGKIEFHGCKEFTLRRISTSLGSEIAGKWKGQYSCLQGETGLTLTIN